MKALFANLGLARPLLSTRSMEKHRFAMILGAALTAVASVGLGAWFVSTTPFAGPPPVAVAPAGPLAGPDSEEEELPMVVPTLDNSLAATTATRRVPLEESSTQSERPASRESVTLSSDASDSDREAGLSVRRVEVALGVAERRPVDAGTSFALGDGDRIFAWVEARNESDVARAIVVTFEPLENQGEIAGYVELTVAANAPRFRTWAWSRHVTEPGQWRAVVRDDQGRILATQTFRVIADC